MELTLTHNKVTSYGKATVKTFEGLLLKTTQTIHLYSVDLEVWSKFAEDACIKRIASKFVHKFECDLQHVNTFSHCVTLTCVLLPQIIFCSDTKVSVLVVMECKRASVIYV